MILFPDILNSLNRSLSDNQLNGSIPTQLGNFPQLQQLSKSLNILFLLFCYHDIKFIE